MIIKKTALAALLAGILMAVTPTGAFAQSRGHFSGGGGYRGQSYSGGGRSYAAPRENYGGRSEYRGGFEGGRRFEGGRAYRGGYYEGGRYFGGYYAAPYIAPYAYGYVAPPACGYYDRWGYWRTDPGCYVSPY